MARIDHVIADSEDDLPEVSDILRSSKTASIKTPLETDTGKHSTDTPRKYETKHCDASPDQESSLSRNYSDSTPESKQRPLRSLKLASVNSLRLPLVDRSSNEPDNNFLGTAKLTTGNIGVRSSPRRKANASVNYKDFVPESSQANLSFSDIDSTFTDLSVFIVPDSASDADSRPARLSGRRKAKRLITESTIRLEEDTMSNHNQWSSENCRSPDLVDVTSPKHEKGIKTRLCPDTSLEQAFTLEDPEPFDLEDPSANLKFSPPRTRTPHKIKNNSRPVTPPLSPAKTILPSASIKHRIPPSPHRPSIDAFWSQDVINDWNEQYSPKRSVNSPRKWRPFPVDDDENKLSPLESSRKTLPKSPAKKDKTFVEQRKMFHASKKNLATSFLAEVDRIIGQGQIAAMAEMTGGIQIIWSRKLLSTAGRANWRREAVRSQSPEGIVSTTTHRHHASIELAEKVIDDENRLVNVIAHEYCHLANFMISGIKDNPHGKEFKEWARLTTKAFAHRNVDVTTKHTYEIAYKYIWACISSTCGLEYKRHSKSIDPLRHSCGHCKSKLLQIQPVPRKGQQKGKRSEYQEFVKSEQARVRLENPGVGFGEIMAILGREFREIRKTMVVKEAEVNVDTNDNGLDSIARRLDFLTLE